jgi:hypothetical protein
MKRSTGRGYGHAQSLVAVFTLFLGLQGCNGETYQAASETLDDDYAMTDYGGFIESNCLNHSGDDDDDDYNSYYEKEDHQNRKGEDFEGVNCHAEDLSHVVLSRSDLEDSDFSAADLSHANLSFADLRNSDMSGANLKNANLTEADLRGTNLSRADLRNADLSGIIIDRRTKFTKARLPSEFDPDALLDPEEATGEGEVEEGETIEEDPSENDDESDSGIPDPMVEGEGDLEIDESEVVLTDGP